jgi:hypothetical protein
MVGLGKRLARILLARNRRARRFLHFRDLLKNDFRRLDFTGLGPINASPWCTSIFYRRKNCFDI